MAAPMALEVWNRAQEYSLRVLVRAPGWALSGSALLVSVEIGHRLATSILGLIGRGVPGFITHARDTVVHYTPRCIKNPLSKAVEVVESGIRPFKKDSETMLAVKLVAFTVLGTALTDAATIALGPSLPILNQGLEYLGPWRLSDNVHLATKYVINYFVPGSYSV